MAGPFYFWLKMGLKRVQKWVTFCHFLDPFFDTFWTLLGHLEVKSPSRALWHQKVLILAPFFDPFFEGSGKNTALSGINWQNLSKTGPDQCHENAHLYMPWIQKSWSLTFCDHFCLFFVNTGSWD